MVHKKWCMRCDAQAIQQDTMVPGLPVGPQFICLHGPLALAHLQAQYVYMARLGDIAVASTVSQPQRAL